VGRLETASKFGHLIESFNINTNGWAASYVYKRLKFMNNRIISQVDTLFCSLNYFASIGKLV
jgi:lysophospholipid acyltransferase 5